MNNILNFKRIGLILRADWIENKKTWMITMGLLLLSIVLVLWDRALVQNKLVGWVILISAILFFNFVEKKLHRSKGLFLTLPASNLEKYISIWLVGLFYLISCSLIFWGVIGLNNLISGLPVVEMHSPNAIIVALLIFFTCWLFAFYCTFRKHAFIIGTALLIALVALWSRLTVGIIMNYMPNGDVEVINNRFGRFLEHWQESFFVVIYLLSAALLYYSYWRLTKKQIR